MSGRRSAPLPPSPRPNLGDERTSRPAVRISRLRPSIPFEEQQQQQQQRATPNPSPNPNTPNPPLLDPAPHARDYGRSQSHSRLRSGSVRRRAGEEQQQQDGQPSSLHPDDPIGVARDSRGQPVLVHVAGEDVHPDPHNTIPIPAENADGVVAVTSGVDDRQSRWSAWLPNLGRRNNTNRDSDADTGRADYATSSDPQSAQYADDVVDWLDVIDPQVATVSTLSNVQNSLFVPDIGFVNRLPLINLQRNQAELAARASRMSAARDSRASSGPPDGRASRTPEPLGDVPDVVVEDADEDEAERRHRRKLRKQERRERRRAEEEESPGVGKKIQKKLKKHRLHHHHEKPSPAAGITEDAVVGRDSETEKTAGSPPSPTLSDSDSDSDMDSDSSLDADEEMRRRERLMRSQETIRGEYAVLPPGLVWDDWTEEERAELDDYVRHLLHSRRERIWRRFRGFLQFVSHPLGFFITLYAFLITFWGAAWVLFLIGWVYVGDRKSYFVEICEQILTALFCLVGIGMAPFRAVDTYHMVYIVHYHWLTRKLRKKRNMPKLTDKNDLPVPNPAVLDPDLEAQFAKDEEPVLTPEQQAKLIHHQKKYHRSHTFYRPHETPTHRAFPTAYLIAITILLDCHSLFQMALGATTWGINYHVRPPALTATILAISISCNVTAGVLISVSTRKTRKVEEVEKRLRQALTEEAMRNLGKGKRTRAARWASTGEHRDEMGALEKVRSRVDDFKDRHGDRRGGEELDPLSDRRARWAARADATTGRKASGSAVKRGQGSSATTPAGENSSAPTPVSKRSRTESDVSRPADVGPR